MDARLYFDVNGSTPLDGAVREAVVQLAGDLSGNPSAAHPEGRRARQAIERARARIALELGAESDEIWLTSGGTESNNWALVGAAAAAPLQRRHLLVSPIEHKSVLRTAEALAARGCELTLLPVGADGAVRVEDVERALRPETFLVALMLANNETGVLQPVAEVAALCRERGVLLHCDVVAAVGKIPVDLRRLGCDSASLSGHKIYAPKGVGVLYLRRDALARDGARADSEPVFPPLIHGCGQQQGMRGGTEDTASVVALGAAFERLGQGAFRGEELGVLRDRLWRGIQNLAPDAVRNGAGDTLPNTLSVSFPGRTGAELQAALGEHGISVAAGAAGANGAPSHVLVAMGLGTERARSTLRFSLGAQHDEQAIDHLLAVLPSVLEPRPQLESTR